MIGKVVAGRYKGCSVYRDPDGKKILSIQTQEGEMIPLTKENVVSLENISEQYPEIQGKVYKVLWNDSQTSIIRLKNSKPKANTNQKTVSGKKNKAKSKKSGKNKKSRLYPIIGIVALILLIEILILVFVPKKHEHTWQNATCLKPKTCETCGETSGKALGHLLNTDGTVCVRCGETADPNVKSESVTDDDSSVDNYLKRYLNIETVKWHKHYSNAEQYHCDLIVKNNSENLLSAGFEITYFDEAGNKIAIDNVSLDAIGAKATHLITAYHDEPFDHAEVSVTRLEADSRNQGGIENLTFTDHPVGTRSVGFEISNNGDKAVSFVRAYVLFYHEEEVADFDYAYAVDEDNELKPGETIKGEVTSNLPYTKYRIFYYGKID